MNKKMMALAILTLAGTAMAQPASFTDLGNRTAPQVFSQAVTLAAAADVQWFRIQLPVVNASTGYVDIWTSAVGDITDTEIGMYAADGSGAGSALTYFDDDSGPGNFSQLTFGSTTERPNLGGDALARNGSDGQLSGGVYYVAVGRYNVTWNLNFGPVGEYTGPQRTTQLNFEIQPATDPYPPAGSGLATPGAVQPGNAVTYTVTVVPGGNPVSTGITVTGDLSVLGGSAASVFHDDGANGDATASDGVYSFQYVMPVGTPVGNYTIPVIIADAQGRSSSATIASNVFTPLDLGTLVDGVTVTQQADVAAFEIKWYKITAAECSDSAGRRLTISTFNTPGDDNDSELGLYTNVGNLVANNDDREVLAGPSRLSFGALGENGNLAAGVYYIALGNYNTVYGATGFAATPDTTTPQHAITYQLDVLQQRIVIWNEQANGGDSGDLPATAQIVAGSENPLYITGEMTANDVDMYRINICDAANFSATTYLGTTADTRLFLFRLDGTGLSYNDDFPDGTPDAEDTTQSRLSGANVPGNGDYYLAITRWAVMASDNAGNNLWHTGTPFNVEITPDGAAQPTRLPSGPALRAPRRRRPTASASPASAPAAAAAPWRALRPTLAWLAVSWVRTACSTTTTSSPSSRSSSPMTRVPTSARPAAWPAATASGTTTTSSPSSTSSSTTQPTATVDR
ncbi:MAG: hypothetical protein QM783_18080 [Phycisphaerales bacterium]